MFFSNIPEERLKRIKVGDKLKETKFASERKEIKEIQAKINELSRKKCQIRKKILEGVKQIEKEKRENKKKIEELQKKMGIIPKPNKKPEIKNDYIKILKEDLSKKNEKCEKIDEFSEKNESSKEKIKKKLNKLNKSNNHVRMLIIII